MNEEQITNLINSIIDQKLSNIFNNEKYTFKKDIKIFDSKNIQLGRTTGTQIGTATDQKVAFFGVDPVVQQAKVDYVAGGTTVDTQARQTVGYLIDRLQAFGLIAPNT